MDALRTGSARPELVVGNPEVARITDPATKTSIGIAGPFGRERCVYALPINGTGPQQYKAAIVVRDEDSAQLADASNNVIGVDGLWISRLLFARWTEDTRRLAG